MQTRIYFDTVKDSLNSDKKLYCTLAYLKIRTIASNRAGYFTFSEAMNVLQNSHKTTLKYINQLTAIGVLKDANGGYRLVNAKKNNMMGLKNKNQRSISLKVEDLLQYNWKNISHFRAMFSEIRNEKDIIAIRAVANGFKCRYGSDYQIIQNRSFSCFNGLYAGTRSAKINKVCLSTAYSYRKKQSLVIYGKQKIERIKYTNGNIKNLYINKGLPLNVEYMGKLGYNLKRLNTGDENAPLLFFNPSPRISLIPSRCSGLKKMKKNRKKQLIYLIANYLIFS